MQRMRMIREEYNTLYEKYLSGNCTREEQETIENYQDSIDLDRLHWIEDQMGDQKVVKETIHAELLSSIARQKRRQILKIRTWYSAAAILLITLSAGLYFNRKTEAPVLAKTIPSRFQNDVLPGDNRAVLTLDDGSRINLDDAKNGLLATENNTDIKKVLAGQVEYSAGTNQAVTQVKYNTLTTPMGGQYQLILPDGSKVWLNAGSSLHFPTAFAGKERRVELKGEAYFEVAKNRAMPFKVIANDMEVKVLGTHFNVMAYEDEKSMNTTLLEGSVQVLKGSGRVYLEPGEEAVLNKTSGNMNVSTADIEQAVAWKNGYFIFSDENIESIMRKVSRWYNVDVTFKGNMNNKDFVGTISRNKNVSELLQMLELTGAVHFSIVPGDASGKGRRIIVMP